MSGHDTDGAQNTTLLYYFPILKYLHIPVLSTWDVTVRVFCWRAGGSPSSLYRLHKGCARGVARAVARSRRDLAPILHA